MRDQQSEPFASPIGKKFEVPGLGSIQLLDVMGDDAAICDAARRTIREKRKLSDDRTLIRHMLRHHHGTPFEMCHLKLIFEMPLVIKNQVIRHRAASLFDGSSMWDEPSVNEFSGRYSEFPERMYKTPPDGWRLQSASNRQGSAGSLPADGDGSRWCGRDLSDFEEQAHRAAWQCYRARIDAGIAREQARKDLPLSTITEFVWCCDLRNVLHFLSLRMTVPTLPEDCQPAQREVRAFADILGREIVAPLFPETFDAFEDYQLNAMTLSALDVAAIQGFARGGMSDVAMEALFPNARERGECRDKLRRLGFLPGEGKVTT